MSFHWLVIRWSKRAPCLDRRFSPVNKLQDQRFLMVWPGHRLIEHVRFMSTLLRYALCAIFSICCAESKVWSRLLKVVCKINEALPKVCLIPSFQLDASDFWGDYLLCVSWNTYWVSLGDRLISASTQSTHVYFLGWIAWYRSKEALSWVFAWMSAVEVSGTQQTCCAHCDVFTGKRNQQISPGAGPGCGYKLWLLWGIWMCPMLQM